VNSNPFIKPNTVINSGLRQSGEGEVLDGSVKDTEKPLPLRALLTRPVLISVANYAMFGLIDMGAVALIPLVWSTSVELGGLSMSPASIGLWMTGCGLLNCIFQFVALPRLVGRFGPRNVFISSILCFFLVYAMFPFENLATRHSGRSMNLMTVLLITLQLSALSLSDMGFGKSPRTLWCVRSLKLCESKRHYMHVYSFCCAQQAVSRRDEWTRADGGLDSARGWASCCRVAVCILTGEQYFGRKLCVYRATRHCVRWAGRSGTASEDHVET
jgi:hypothetical protein